MLCKYNFLNTHNTIGYRSLSYITLKMGEHLEKFTENGKKILGAALNYK